LGETMGNKGLELPEPGYGQSCTFHLKIFPSPFSLLCMRFPAWCQTEICWNWEKGYCPFGGKKIPHTQDKAI